MTDKGMTYQQSGVDVSLAEQTVKRIEEMVRKTDQSQVFSGIGGFAGIFRLPESTGRSCLVGTCDGVGTKLKVAIRLESHQTVGIDLVAMCINDLLCSGAKPLFFLDYYACGKLRPSHLEQVMSGIVEGCRQAKCALLGGETAEMPELYQGIDYDLAGFAVGLVNEESIIDGRDVTPGDRIIALPSAGLHSNGFSLVRKVLDRSEIDYDAVIDDHSLRMELLKPTRIYVQSLETLFQSGTVKGVAHITGGGIPGNLPRILPRNCGAVLNRKQMEVPWIFRFLQKTGEIREDEMWRTFNMGIGMVVIVDRSAGEAARKVLIESGEHPVDFGEIVSGRQEVFFDE